VEPFDPKKETTAEAIAYLTAVYETPPGKTSNELSRELLDKAVLDDGGMRLLAGFINLSYLLLAKIEKATEQPPDEVLQDVARYIQRQQ
jgi:hypothetical protein